MASRLVEFMKESVLFDKKSIEARYRSLSYKRLESELAKYRDFCVSNFKNPIETKNKELSVLVEGFNFHKPDRDFLSQSALYVDQVVLNDPLFELTKTKGEHDKVASKYLGFSSDEKPDRVQVAQAAIYLRDMKKALQAGFVKFMPMSYLHEPPKEIPLRVSENLFFEVLPSEVLEFFHSHVKIKPLTKTEKGWAITSSEIEQLGRAIAVSFGDSKLPHALYFLMQTQVLSIDENTREVKFIQYLPDTPPEPQLFQNWITQSTNQAAKRLFDMIINEMELAHQNEAVYLTRSTFIAALLEKRLKFEQNFTTEITNLALNLDIPVLNNVPLNTILDIREKEGEAFENFRTDLRKRLRGLRQIADQEKLRIEMENTSHELSEVQIHEIDRKIATIKRRMVPDTFILVCGLTAIIQANGLGLAALGYAIDKGIRNYNDYITTVKENPAFFLWKLKEKSQSKSIKK
ncbi:MAG: hypothetical protein HGA41_03615 [Syntrophaceae bacterium]|nr:hypothetical protein [Syntrophaceae bacterium]